MGPKINSDNTNIGYDHLSNSGFCSPLRFHPRNVYSAQPHFSTVYIVLYIQYIASSRCSDLILTATSYNCRTHPETLWMTNTPFTCRCTQIRSVYSCASASLQLVLQVSASHKRGRIHLASKSFVQVPVHLNDADSGAPPVLAPSWLPAFCSVVCVGSVLAACVGSVLAAYVGSILAAYVGSTLAAYVGSTLAACVGSILAAYVGSTLAACVGSILAACVGSVTSCVLPSCLRWVCCCLSDNLQALISC